MTNQNLVKLVTKKGQNMYFMHEIIPSLANHDIPKESLPNCGMGLKRKNGEDTYPPRFSGSIITAPSISPARHR